MKVERGQDGNCGSSNISIEDARTNFSEREKQRCKRRCRRCVDGVKLLLGSVYAQDKKDAEMMRAALFGGHGRPGLLPGTRRAAIFGLVTYRLERPLGWLAPSCAAAATGIALFDGVFAENRPSVT